MDSAENIIIFNSAMRVSTFKSCYLKSERCSQKMNRNFFTSPFFLPHIPDLTGID